MTQAPETMQAPQQRPGWWQRFCHRCKGLVKGTVDYLKTGIISAAVMVGGATLLGNVEALGAVGKWIGTNMGATSWAEGLVKVARIVGIGIAINGAVGIAAAAKADDAPPAPAPDNTQAARKREGDAPMRVVQQEYDMPQANPNKSLPQQPAPGRAAQPSQFNSFS